jgi:hypothetical protein
MRCAHTGLRERGDGAPVPVGAGARIDQRGDKNASLLLVQRTTNAPRPVPVGYGGEPVMDR